MHSPDNNKNKPSSSTEAPRKSVMPHFLIVQTCSEPI
jgi:hypothetical protein